jgi:DNA mismatch repair protein MutS
MQIDNTTYSDLAVFQATDEFSIFTKLDRTRTVGGRIKLLEFFNHPFSQLDKIQQTQKILQIILDHENEWGPSISNGTVMVMERFYETPLDKIPASHDPVSARMYQLLHAPDYSLRFHPRNVFHSRHWGKNELSSPVEQPVAEG